MYEDAWEKVTKWLLAYLLFAVCAAVTAGAITLIGVAAGFITVVRAAEDCSIKQYTASNHGQIYRLETQLGRNPATHLIFPDGREEGLYQSFSLGSGVWRFGSADGLYASDPVEVRPDRTFVVPGLEELVKMPVPKDLVWHEDICS